METEITVALIGASAVIGAAIINNMGKKKKSDDKPIKIKQSAIGKDISQVGIQNNNAPQKDGGDNV